MRFSGYTDPEDFNIKTLLAMLIDKTCWNFWYANNWKFGFEYFWYDGPIFMWNVGPFGFGLADA